MRVAGRIAADALVEVGRHVAPGVTTDELDRIGHEFLIEHGAYPSTLGYKGYRSRCAPRQRGHLPRHPRLAPARRTATS